MERLVTTGRWRSCAGAGLLSNEIPGVCSPELAAAQRKLEQSNICLLVEFHLHVYNRGS
jgi:hypothetical protein